MLLPNTFYQSYTNALYAFNKHRHISKEFKLENQYDVSCILLYLQIEAQNIQYFEVTFEYISIQFYYCLDKYFYISIFN